jgi:hypothetical protein
MVNLVARVNARGQIQSGVNMGLGNYDISDRLVVFFGHVLCFESHSAIERRCI